MLLLHVLRLTYVWHTVAAALCREGFQVITVDLRLRICGKTGVVLYPIERSADDCAFYDRLSIGTATLSQLLLRAVAATVRSIIPKESKTRSR